MKRFIAITALLLVIPMPSSAQSELHPYRGQGYGFFGLGTGLGYTHPLVEQLGFGGDGFLYKGFGFGGEAAWSHFSRFGYDQSAWIGSLDASYHFRRHAARGGVDPFVLGGFSLYGPTSKEEGGRGQPGGNFGGGVNLWLADHAALRLEFRQHINAGNYLPANTAIAFRVGFTFR
jgi:hypothetical protein